MPGPERFAPPPAPDAAVDAEIRGRRSSTLSTLFLVAGVVSIGVALARSLDESGGSIRPPWASCAAAALAIAVGHVAAARGWIAAFDDLEADHRALARAYYVSQLGKYVPGGFWQPVSQVAYARHGAVTVRRAGTAYLVGVVGWVVAGTVIGGIGVALGGSRVPAAVRAVAVGAAMTAILLTRRSTLRRLLALVPGRLRRRTALEVPSQRAIVRCASWTACCIALHAAAFAILLTQLEPAVSEALVVGAFGAAWLAGYVVVFAPSGIGVREAVLVWVLSVASVPAAAILGASVAQRVAGIAAEAVLAGQAHVRVRRAADRRSGAPP